VPQYEYESMEDGAVLTLLRPMAEADDPVVDPEDRGRTFKRRHSVFGVGSTQGGSMPQPGSCACGLKPGTCGGN
jgi:predicted nucleic acid-binding Zn ribbon protein